MIKKRHQK